MSKAEKKVVKVTVNKKKRTVTVKGVKAGKATFKIGSKSYTVKVGATSITKKTVTTSMKVGQKKTLSVNAVNGKGDTIQFTSSKKSVVKVNTASKKVTNKVASTTVTALKAGTAKITAKSKYTGKSKVFTIKVTGATVTPAPVVSTNPAVVATTPAATATVTNTPGNGGNGGSTTTKAPETTSGAATNAPGTSVNPDETKNPDTTGTPSESNAPGATDDVNATSTPEVTNTPEVTTTPAVTTEPAATATPSAIEFTAKQTGDKKITVTNPTAMTKKDIVVKRGNSTVTIDKVDIDEAGTTAVVTLAGSIVATDYTVTVGESSKTFTGEASIVKDIQITSDEVALDGQIGTSYTGFANYAVYNQFGENITAKTSLVANSSASVSLNPTEGTITIDWGSGNEPRLNDLVSVVLMYQNTGVSTSKMLKVATQAAPAEVEIKGVYNADGKVLSATNATNGDFYYLFRVKDQYGNYMTSNSVHFSDDTSPANAYKKNIYLTTAIGMTNVDIDTTTLNTKNVDGVNYLCFPIGRKEAGSVVAGDITVMLIPGGSGKTVTDTITVGKGNTVTSLTISVPGSIPSGETMDLEYVALDENGDDVTSYRVLKEVKPSDTIGFKWIKEDGKVVLRYDDSTKSHGSGVRGTAPGSAVSCVFQLPNYETRLVTINVTDPIHIASIAGVDSDVAKATRVNDVVTIGVDKLSLQDQYGNSIGTSNLVANAASPSDKGIAVMVIEEDSSNAIFTPTLGYTACKYTDKNGKPDANAYILGSNGTFSFDSHATLLGTENVTFKLVQYDADTTNGGSGATWRDYETDSYTGATTNNTQVGSFTTTLTNTENKRFVSYDVNTINTIYADSNSKTAYEKTVEVKGVLSNGEKVELTAGDDFKVVPGENLAAGTVDADANIAAKASLFNDPNTNDTKTGKYNVVINYTGETIEKTVTIANTYATTAKVAFDDGYTKKGVNITATNLNKTDGTSAKFFMAEDGASVNIIKTEDSYGVTGTVSVTGEVTLSDTAAGPDADGKEQMIYTISDIDTENGVVSENGTATPKFENFEAGDSFKLTYTVGAATFSTIVSVQ